MPSKNLKFKPSFKKIYENGLFGFAIHGVRKMPTKVLHVLDHSLPHLSGYAIRTHNILSFQKKNGIEVYALTSPKHGNGQAQKFDDIFYDRTRNKFNVKVPYFAEIFLMRELLNELRQKFSVNKIDIIHAHSPVLNGWPAYLIAK